MHRTAVIYHAGQALTDEAESDQQAVHVPVVFSVLLRAVFSPDRYQETAGFILMTIQCGAIVDVCSFCIVYSHYHGHLRTPR